MNVNTNIIHAEILAHPHVGILTQHFVLGLNWKDATLNAKTVGKFNYNREVNKIVTYR